VTVNTLLATLNEAKLSSLARTNYSSYLSDVELRIIHDSVRPGPAKPQKGDHAGSRHVAGDFLRWLVNDSAAVALLDKDGLQVTAATIDGEVDLDSSHIHCNITFENCIFTTNMHFVGADMHSLYISNSEARGDIAFDNATIAGEIRMEPSFRSSGTVRFYGTHISSDLSMDGAKLTSNNGNLSLDGADIKGVVYLQKLCCSGTFSALNAKLGSDLIATEAKFASSAVIAGSHVAGRLDLIKIQASDNITLENDTVGGDVSLGGSKLYGAPTSLSLDYSAIDGKLTLVAEFAAAGSVSLIGTTVNQGLWAEQAAMKELNCTDARIGGVLVWAEIRRPEQTKLTLVRTSVRVLQDVKKSWPVKGSLKVAGLVYQQISLAVPTDIPDLGHTTWRGTGPSPDDRIAWLFLQSDEDQLISQPWLQLAQLLQANGSPEGAAQVLFTMERIQAKQQSLPVRYLSFFYDVIDENPLRIVAPIFGLWALATVVFWRARRMKAMSPRDKDAYNDFLSKGEQSPHYVPFNPAIYALENVLPVVKLGQDDAWGPNPQTQSHARTGLRRWLPQMSYNWLASLRWVLIVVGWGLALILAGAIASRFK
jgi:hypothetical protein